MEAVEGKVVVVTGGTSGIGEGIVKAFAAAGAKVVFCGRRKEKGEEVAKTATDAGGNVKFSVADMLKFEDIDNVFKVAEEEYGGVDVVVANAGIPGKQVAVTDDDFFSNMDDVFAVNLKSVIQTCRVGARHLEKREKGVCFVMSSMLSSLPQPNYCAYCMSKASLDALARCLSAETPENVEVYSINPGYIQSEMVDRALKTFSLPNADPLAAQLNPTEKLGTAQGIAQLIANTIAGKYKEIFPPGSSIFTDSYVMMEAKDVVSGEFKKNYVEV